MSIRAGSIVTVAGRNVVDRLQSAGLGDVRVPVETIREIGNDLVVDKVPGEPDFTFTMESWDVSTDLMAWLHGKVGTQTVGDPPGASDDEGTEYKWEDCEFVNVTSPWKRNTGSEGGNIDGGLLIPGYYPTRMRYRFGVTDNATHEVELAGGAFYYAEYAPVEEIATGTGAQTAFVTSEAARALRLGGPAGTTFQRVFGVLVDGVLQVKDVDYTETAAAGAGATAATITFTTAPANGAQVKYCYFTDTAKAFPQAVNADTTIKPGAVRGRDIFVYLGARASNEVQTVTITGSPTGGTFTLTFDGETTAAIDWDATAEEVETALEALPNIGTGNVMVTGGPGPGTAWVVTFTGDLGGANQALMTDNDAGLTGGTTPAVTVTETTAGGTAGSRIRLPGIQTVELEATVEGEVEREMGNREVVGRTINGTDVTGTFTIRPKDIDAFFDTLSRATGRARTEVFDFLNQEEKELEIQIRNPKNRGQILKTLYVQKGQFQPPGTPARVNTATDFSFQFNAVNGTFSEFKGARP